MERIIRVMLFLVLSALGLDHTQTQRQLDALKPPRMPNALQALYTLPPPPEPPPPPPPPLFSQLRGGMP